MGEFIIKARGLPWATTSKDMLDFFSDCSIVGGEEGIHLTLDKEGRASGDCFVELASELDLEKAKAHNKEHIGSRYVEIHDSKRSEMEWQINRLGGPGSGPNRMGGGENSDGFVKLRGLPYEATKKDIADFFAGIEIAPYGITMTMDQDGRASGEAYVEFTSPAGVEQALAKNKEKIGHRYIEIFNSSKNDVKYVTQANNYGGGGFSARPMGGRPGPYDRPGNSYGGQSGANSLGPSGFNTAGLVRNSRGGRGGRNMGNRQAQNPASTTGHMVHMRGLPFEATQGDVFKFFAPLSPVEVRILYEESGRPKGECDVDFNSHSDAESAMLKDKENMGHRYIELFLRSTERSLNAPLLPQMNNMNPPGLMNSGGQSNMAGGYGGGYGGGGGGGNDFGGNMGGGNMGGGGAGGGSYGMGGGGAGGGNYGNFSSNGYGLGGSASGYSSFNEKSNFSGMAPPNSYYSNMR